MRTTTLQDRIMIREAANAGQTDHQIAQLLGWSVRTVRKWRHRGQQGTPAHLASHMGRPTAGALSTFSPLVRETLQLWRRSHPGWGPQTLRTQAEDEPALRGQRLPDRASIARWLTQQGFTRRYDRHRPLPAPPVQTVTAPHMAWEMDARGYQTVPGVGVVALINVNDRFSRVKLISYPCWLGEQRATRHPATADYQLVLRLAFSEWGLPDRLCVDRDSVFYDNKSRSPFPTQFHLWLLGLGVTLDFGPPRHPTERGMTERSHQTWAHQVLDGATFASWIALRDTLRQRRDFLNQRLPCASLEGIPPLEVYPEARTPRRLYRPEWEDELLDLSRVYAYLSQGQWFRRGSDIGGVSLGTHVYVVGPTWARQDVQITFDATDQHLVFQTADGELTTRQPVKGLTPRALMGDLAPLVQMDGFQLALPFSWNEWRMLQACAALDDTS